MDNKALNISWPEHQKNVLGFFHNLYENSKLVDVTLTCLEGSIRAHKTILSTCSPFFQRIIEENPCKHPVLILRGTTLKEMKRILDFMYTGIIRAQESEIHSILKTAEELDITGLKNCLDSRYNTVLLKDKRKNKRSSDTYFNDPTPKKISKLPQLSNSESNKIDVWENNTTQNNVSASVEENAPSHGRETRFKGKKRVEVHHDRIRIPKPSTMTKSKSLTIKNNTDHNDVTKLVIKGTFL